jgi:hypothetical protein
MISPTISCLALDLDRRAGLVQFLACDQAVAISFGSLVDGLAALMDTAEPNYSPITPSRRRTGCSSPRTTCLSE